MVYSVETNPFLWAGRMFSFSNDSLLEFSNQHFLDLQLFNDDLDNEDLEGEDENELYDEEAFEEITSISSQDENKLSLATEVYSWNNTKVVTTWALSSELWIIALILNSSSIFKSTFCDLAISEQFNNKFASYVFKSKLSSISFMLCAWLGNQLLSLSNVIPAVEWAEREAWDMHGVFFIGSWDLRRILTDYGFRFFPMLKQVPLSGYSQCVYDDYSKVVSYESVELSQGFRA